MERSLLHETCAKTPYIELSGFNVFCPALLGELENHRGVFAFRSLSLSERVSLSLSLSLSLSFSLFLSICPLSPTHCLLCQDSLR